MSSNTTPQLKVIYTHIDPITGKQYVVEATNALEAQKLIEELKTQENKPEQKEEIKTIKK